MRSRAIRGSPAAAGPHGGVIRAIEGPLAGVRGAAPDADYEGAAYSKEDLKPKRRFAWTGSTSVGSYGHSQGQAASQRHARRCV